MDLLEALIVDPTFIAAFFTVLGGITLKLLEKWLGRGSFKIEINKDYREEISELHDRLDKEEAEVALWRTKYFESEEKNHKLRVLMIDFRQEEEEAKNAQEDPPPDTLA